MVDMSLYRLEASYRFGNTRRDATVRNKTQLDRVAANRYIYGDGRTTGPGTDGLYGQYRSRHADYPEGDPRSLHVFTGNSLILRAIATRGLGEGEIESGIVRFFAPVIPNASRIVARMKVARGMWGWNSLWLNPGKEDYAPRDQPRGAVSALDWPPEIDIHDGFGYETTVPGSVLRPGEPTGNNDARFNRKIVAENAAWAVNPSWDYRRPGEKDGWLADGFHVWECDWFGDQLTYSLDGVAFRTSQLTWNSIQGVPAHLLITNAIAPMWFTNLGQISDQGGVARGWDFEIDYAEVYRRRGT